MKSASPLVSAAAALLLHAALIVLVITGLSTQQSVSTPPVPIAIELLPAPPSAPPTPLPVAAQAPPEKKRPEPKHRSAPKPTPAPHEIPAPRTQVPDVAFDAKPAPSNSTAISAPPAPVQAAPTPPRTSISVATYAASNRKPSYPRLSRVNDEQGTVMLRVLVRADGTAGAVELKTSSGYPLLDESARTTVQTWRFNPATVDGKPVAEWYQLAIPFTLQNN